MQHSATVVYLEENLCPGGEAMHRCHQERTARSLVFVPGSHAPARSYALPRQPGQSIGAIVGHFAWPPWRWENGGSVGLAGRKTDISDCAWLARLGECELLKAVRPAGPVRHLRDLPIETLLIRAHGQEPNTDHR
jgi:hypothetical protein